MDLFFLLLFGHSIGDFGLQGELLSVQKHRTNNPMSWYIFMLAHSVIHGGFVGFFTGSLLLALLETVAHFVIDFGKTESKYGLQTDQLLHVACKGAWVLLMAQGIA